jgi:putative SOS response-associated peptidase YedK
MMGDMCGRYVVATPFQQMALDFGALADLGFAPPGAPGYAADYNVAPTKPVPVVWQRSGTRASGGCPWRAGG